MRVCDIRYYDTYTYTNILIGNEVNKYGYLQYMPDFGMNYHLRTMLINCAYIDLHCFDWIELNSIGLVWFGVARLIPHFLWSIKYIYRKDWSFLFFSFSLALSLVLDFILFNNNHEGRLLETRNKYASSMLFSRRVIDVALKMPWPMPMLLLLRLKQSPNPTLPFTMK